MQCRGLSVVRKGQLKMLPDFFAFLLNVGKIFVVPQDLGKGELDIGETNGNTFVFRFVGVSYFRKHVCYGVHSFGLLVCWSAGCNLANQKTRNYTTSYQLDFVTPGISPLFASSRKQIRQRSNARIYPRLRPHRKHRLTTRDLNFAFLTERAMTDCFAMVIKVTAS